ncbi:sugar O-acetyltransferase [Pseudarthrobacter sp. So.54]
MDLEAQRAHMRQGATYNDLTPELVDARERTVIATNKYNASFGQAAAQREPLLAKILGSMGTGAHFEPAFRCEFGYNISIGTNFYANFDCILLDGADITIGNNVLFGPRVSIYTTNHALDARERAAGACYAKPVHIGNNVWVGGGVTINQGVTIGDNAVIGSGSVVTRDVPPNSLALGVPAKVIRKITDADRSGYLDA